MAAMVTILKTYFEYLSLNQKASYWKYQVEIQIKALG